MRKRAEDKLPRELNQQLDHKGLLAKQGTLVDASLVEAQGRPPRKDEPAPKTPMRPGW